MHISTVYLSTYSSEEPICGHMDIKDNETKSQFQIVFNHDECLRIQEICSEALHRHRNDAIKALIHADIMPPALPKPKEFNLVEDGEYLEVSGEEGVVL